MAKSRTSFRPGSKPWNLAKKPKEGRKRTFYIARDVVSGQRFLAAVDCLCPDTSIRIAGQKPTGNGTIELERFRARSDEAAIIRFNGGKASGHYRSNQPVQPQEHYKRIGSIGGKTNKGRRYNAANGFVLVDGRWRNPNNVEISRWR